MSLYISTTTFDYGFGYGMIIIPGDILIHLETVDQGGKKGRIERFLLPNGKLFERWYAWNCPLGRRHIIPFDRGAPAVARMPEWSRRR